MKTIGQWDLSWFGQIYNIYLNTSAVFSKRYYEQSGMLHEDYQSFESTWNCQESLAIGRHYTKRCKDFVGNLKKYGTF